MLDHLPALELVATRSTGYATSTWMRAAIEELLWVVLAVPYGFSPTRMFGVLLRRRDYLALPRRLDPAIGVESPGRPVAVP